jgi:hypothetical protein
MSDRSYMTVIVHDCPTKKRKVAELLAEYGLAPNTWDDDTKTFLPVPEEIEAGVQYTVEETSLGSATELAGRLIALAPHCSFQARQEPHYTCLGDLVCYTPKLGRFDGEIDHDGTVVKGHQETASLVAEGVKTYIRDAGRGDLGRLFYAPQEAIEAVMDVAFGKPWLTPDADITDTQRKRWLPVIDARWAQAWERGQAILLAHFAELKTSGLADLPVITTPPPQFEAARAAAAKAETALKETAQREGARHYWDLPHGHLPGALRAWASVWETAWRGRRRP